MKEQSSNSVSSSTGEDRGRTVEKLESVYKDQYGEYMYYAGQTFVFRDGDIANKTLLISDQEQYHNNRPYLKFRARPVYIGDSEKDLKEVMEDWSEEDLWYQEQFGNIPGLDMPKENYSICDDPMDSGNNTVLISTEWVDNIKGDIFRIDPQILYGYITKYPEFKNTLIGLIKQFKQLSEEDIYPDYLGEDNVAIYLKENIPHIALIDRHIVWIGEHCRSDVKNRLDEATNRFDIFLQDPMNIENIKHLAKGDFK